MPIGFGNLYSHIVHFQKRRYLFQLSKLGGVNFWYQILCSSCKVRERELLNFYVPSNLKILLNSFVGGNPSKCVVFHNYRKPLCLQHAHCNSKRLLHLLIKILSFIPRITPHIGKSRHCTGVCMFHNSKYLVFSEIFLDFCDCIKKYFLRSSFALIYFK